VFGCEIGGGSTSARVPSRWHGGSQHRSDRSCASSDLPFPRAGPRRCGTVPVDVSVANQSRRFTPPRRWRRPAMCPEPAARPERDRPRLRSSGPVRHQGDLYESPTPEEPGQISITVTRARPRPIESSRMRSRARLPRGAPSCLRTSAEGRRRRASQLVAFSDNPPPQPVSLRVASRRGPARRGGVPFALWASATALTRAARELPATSHVMRTPLIVLESWWCLTPTTASSSRSVARALAASSGTAVQCPSGRFVGSDRSPLPAFVQLPYRIGSSRLLSQVGRTVVSPRRVSTFVTSFWEGSVTSTEHASQLPW
jgi:hypothetical protein